jgi:hypothetical protein
MRASLRETPLMIAIMFALNVLWLKMDTILLDLLQAKMP